MSVAMSTPMMEIILTSPVDGETVKRTIPMWIAQESKLLKEMMDNDNNDNDNKQTIPIAMPMEPAYFDKMIQFYIHYSDYFQGMVEPTDHELAIAPVTRAMVINPKSIHARKQKEASDAIVRPNHIPSFVFTPHEQLTMSINKTDQVDVAILTSFREEFFTKWCNEFDRTYFKSLHTISTRSDKYPNATDGIMTTNVDEENQAGAAPQVERKLSLFRLRDYIGYMLFEQLDKIIKFAWEATLFGKTVDEIIILTGNESRADEIRADAEAKANARKEEQRKKDEELIVKFKQAREAQREQQ